MSFIFSASIAAQDYYKKSVEALKKHQLASDTIGKPIRIPYLNLARKDIRVDNRTAQARNIILCCSRDFFFLDLPPHSPWGRMGGKFQLSSILLFKLFYFGF